MGDGEAASARREVLDLITQARNRAEYFAMDHVAIALARLAEELGWGGARGVDFMQAVAAIPRPDQR